MFITHRRLDMPKENKSIEDMKIEIQVLRRELDDSIYYEDPDYVVERICEKLYPLEAKVSEIS